MLFHTHLMFGALLGYYFLSYFGLGTNVILFFAFVLIGSMLPDLDHPNSQLGKYFKLINWLFVHRGFFHSVFFLILVFIFSYLFIGSLIYALALALGVLSHIVLDALTKKGVMIFYPVSKGRISGPLLAGSFANHAFFILFLLVLLFEVFILV